MITIDQIKARCIEEGDCWIWQGALTSQGYPIMKHNGSSISVRRVVVALDGRPAKARQPVVCACDDKRCVMPTHLSRSTASKVAQKTADTGIYGAKARCAKVAAFNRARSDTKLTIEIAREIRASEESGPVLAERYGVTRSRINAIKRGEMWKDYNSSPFAGLGARA